MVFKNSNNGNRLAIVLCSALALFHLCSCSHKPDPSPSWDYGTEGIRITYTADRLLNAVDEKSHTLLLTIYQLKDTNTFSKLSQYEEGLKKLLEAQSVDSSVMTVEKFFVEPGESKTIVRNRAENARWVAVVAGYYNLDPAKVSRVFEIPFKVETKGFISKERVAKVPQFQLNLILGPQGIQEKKIQ